MSQCECGAAGEPRDIIDLHTPLYQACGGRLYRLHISTSAAAVLMGDGASVETRVNSLERALLANTTTYFADSIAGRDALAPLAPGDRCYVFDASADSTVPSGAAMYIWLPSRKWRKLYNGDSPVDAQNLVKAGGGLGAQDNKLYVKAADIIGAGLEAVSGKIAVDMAALCGAGLNVDGQGKISVKVDDLPDAQLGLLAAALVAGGGGLKTVSGKLAVKAEELIKANGGLKAENGKLAVDLAQLPAADLAGLSGSLARPGGGLAAGEDGMLSVDFSSMPASTLKPMVLAMIQTGGGLMVDEQGKIYFDPESMDTAVFDRMLKALRLPKWLGSSMNFYVDKSHANAGDSLVEGRGLSQSLPFASIQACVNYICDNFNLGGHNVYVNVAAGDYTGENSLVLGNFNTVTGSIILQGAARTQTILPRINCVASSPWQIKRLTARPTLAGANSLYSYAIGCDGAGGNIYDMVDVTADLSLLDQYGGNMYGFMARSGHIRWWASETESGAGIYFIPPDGATVAAVLKADGPGSEISLAADLGLLTRDLECQDFAQANNKGSIVAAVSQYQYPGRAPKVSTNGHAVTGGRYHAYTGGTINIGGAGPDFFPGTTAGSAEAATYAWYK